VKVGDLVKWTHSSGPDVGVIMDCDVDGVFIMWSEDPAQEAYHPIDHDNIEVINEGR
jgi:hypothetical protein